MTGLLMFLYYTFNPFHTPNFKPGDCVENTYVSELDLDPPHNIYLRITRVGKNSYEYVFYWPDHPKWTDSDPRTSRIEYKDADYHKVDCP